MNDHAQQLAAALAEVERLRAERNELLAWKADGDELFASGRPGIWFRIGEWWASRPWRSRASEPHQVYGIVDPDYARAFTVIRCLAWSYGYAATMNGSFTRDLDVLLVPWTEHASPPGPLINMIAEATGLKKLGNEPGEKPHGRLAWTLLFPAFGDPRWVDISVMPRLVQSK